MPQAQLIEEWWQEPGMGDLSMEEDHIGEGFWNEVLEQVIDLDLGGKKILDFGCNRGGFLRALHEKHPYREAVGVDIAAQSVAAAEANKGALPVRYLALNNLDSLDRDFDVATSTAVIYLIDDIADHARQIYARLRPGGVYFATHPDYVGNPAFAVTRQMIDRHAAVPCAKNDLKDIVAAFEAAGFAVSIKRIPPSGYAPVRSNGSWYGTLSNQIDFIYHHRYAFRCVKPGV